LDDPRQRRLDHLAGRSRDHEEREPAALEPAVQELDERPDVMAKADPPARLHQVLAPNPAEFGIMPNQVRELAPLMNEVAPGEPVDLLLEAVGAKQFAEHETGVVETERLVEIRRHEKMPLNRDHGHRPSSDRTAPCRGATGSDITTKHKQHKHSNTETSNTQH